MRRGAASRRRKSIKQRNRAAQHDEEVLSEDMHQREAEHIEHVETPAQRLAHGTMAPALSPGQEVRGAFSLRESIEMTEVDPEMVPFRDLHDLSEESLLDPDYGCLLYTSPSPRDATLTRMPSSA